MILSIKTPEVLAAKRKIKSPNFGIESTTQSVLKLLAFHFDDAGFAYEIKWNEENIFLNKSMEVSILFKWKLLLFSLLFRRYYIINMRSHNFQFWCGCCCQRGTTCCVTQLPATISINELMNFSISERQQWPQVSFSRFDMDHPQTYAKDKQKLLRLCLQDWNRSSTRMRNVLEIVLGRRW